MRKSVALFATAVALAIAPSALADPPGGGGYGSQPGYEEALSHTACADHGSFGAFGNFGDIAHDFGVNNPGTDGEPGADGQQTGSNNSHLCGDPHND